MDRTLRAATCIFLLLLAAGCSRAPDAPADVAGEARYEVSVLIPGSPFHGIHGLTFDPRGQILAGSVVGMTIYAVDPIKGTVRIEHGPPEGQADDLDFADDGTLAWTAFTLGQVYLRDPDGTVRVVANGLPGINSIAFRADGRLYATQVFLGDALYEIDREGVAPPRLIIEGMGGLNGFDFGPDDKLYGPLWFRGQVVRVDVDSGALETVASGFQTPAAVNFDSTGNLFAIDSETGEIFRIDVAEGTKEVIATAPTNLDNLAFDRDDRLYITNMSDNAIYEVNRDNGDLRRVVGGPLTTPAGLDVLGDTLYIADTFTLSRADRTTGEVTDISRLISDHEYPIAVSATADRLIIASSNAGMVQGYDRASEERAFRWMEFVSPGGVLGLDDGRVVVAETGAGRVVVVADGDGTERRLLLDGLAEPMGLALDEGGMLYVSDAGTGRILKVPLAGGTAVEVAAGLADPEGIDLDADGNLLVAEVGHQRVLRIAPDGGRSVVAEGLPVGLKGYPGLPESFLPTGLAVAGDGTIYVSSDLDNTILEIRRK